MRVRGGNLKFRALRLEQGNFSWGSEGVYEFRKFVKLATFSIYSAPLITMNWQNDEITRSSEDNSCRLGRNF